MRLDRIGKRMFYALPFVVAVAVLAKIWEWVG